MPFAVWKGLALGTLVVESAAPFLLLSPVFRSWTRALAIVVSESSLVRIFAGGKLLAEIIPEIWLLDRHQSRLQGRVETEQVKDMTVLVTQQ